MSTRLTCLTVINVLGAIHLGCFTFHKKRNTQ